ncbi:MAG: ABC transporter permease [Clostridia bacterium]|nr:ABC transporter permease [Clostridia bacterium]
MKTLQNNKKYIISLIISIAIALLIGAILMAVSGFSPIEGYGAMIDGAIGSPRLLGNTIEKSMELCLLGLATAIGAKGGLFNVGGEGQLFVGALFSTMIGLWLSDLPTFLVIIIAVIVSIVTGGIYALIPALLKTKLNVDEVITTIMLNTVAIKVCTYFVNGPWNSPLKSISQGTDYIDKSIVFSKIIQGSNLSTSFFIGTVVTVFMWFLMKKTTVGLEINVTGENKRFSFFSGLKANKLMVTSMIISGAICGLVGMMLIYGYQGHMTQSASNEYYFDGMLVAMIMNYNPIGIIIMSFFFGFMATGATMMDMQVGISVQLYDVIFSIIIFLMAAQTGIMVWLENRKTQKKAKQLAEEKAKGLVEETAGKEAE